MRTYLFRLPLNAVRNGHMKRFCYVIFVISLFSSTGCNIGRSSIVSDQPAPGAGSLYSKLAAAAMVRRTWSSPELNEPEISDSEVQRNIDPSIVGNERQIVALAMGILPPWERENVIVIGDSGEQYVSRPELRQMFQPAVSEVPVFSHNTDGTVEPLAVALPPSTSGNTGAFRRVYSDTATQDHYTGGYSGEVASVLLPCGNVSNLQSAGRQHTLYGDTGFVYIEGFDDNNLNFEVGFQYSADNQNFAPYYTTGTYTLIASGTRFACSNMVTMQFSMIDYVNGHDRAPII